MIWGRTIFGGFSWAIFLAKAVFWVKQYLGNRFFAIHLRAGGPSISQFCLIGQVLHSAVLGCERQYQHQHQHQQSTSSSLLSEVQWENGGGVSALQIKFRLTKKIKAISTFSKIIREGHFVERVFCCSPAGIDQRLITWVRLHRGHSWLHHRHIVDNGCGAQAHYTDTLHRHTTQIYCTDIDADKEATESLHIPNWAIKTFFRRC